MDDDKTVCFFILSCVNSLFIIIMAFLLEDLKSAAEGVEEALRDGVTVRQVCEMPPGYLEERMSVE